MSPNPRERATSASATMFTIAPELRQRPSGSSGNDAGAMSVTTRPSTESPRNSSRSFVTSVACSNAYERCVSAASRSAGVVERHAERPVQDSSDTSTGSELTPLLDLDGLPAGVVPAVAAHPVRKLGLMTLRALRVRRGLGLPVRCAFRTAGLALLLLRDGHRSPSRSSGFDLLASVQVRSSRSWSTSSRLAQRGSTSG